MKENLIKLTASELEPFAVGYEQLSSDYVDIATTCECPMDDSTPRNAMENNYPLATWLLSTPMSQMMRRRFNLDHVRPTENGWEMDVPGTFWTSMPEDTGEECCWIPLKFDKCCSKTPLNILCLKACDSVFNKLVKRDLNVTSRTAMQGIARQGESVSEVERRIERLSFAFFQAETAILGMDNTYANPLKPFHGLMQVLENPAIQTIFANDIYVGFEELGCRLDVLGYLDASVIAVNPLIYNSIDAAIQPGQNGQLPSGWSREGGRLRFKGIPFLKDKRVPVDMTSMTGEAWLLDGHSVGLFMASNFMVTDSYIFDSSIEQTTDKCGANCRYYYNYGGAFGNNANRLAKIVGIPVNSACASVLGDLKGLISPQTLIPAGVVAGA